MIADDVRDAVERPGPLLVAALARRLAEVGWRRMAAAGIEPVAYSTTRALNLDAALPIRTLTSVPLGDTDAAMRIDAFAEGVPTRYGDLGMRETDLAAARLEAAIGSGACALAAHPPALATTAALARILHPLAVDDADVDVSYSDPEVPFSIFVGVHAKRVRDEPHRLAEGMLHETLHLQLSLIEDVLPLVSGATERWTSPWQRRPRPVQGILHGLYVFRGIEEFLSASGRDGGPAEAYAVRRLETIREEIRRAGAVVDSAELTGPGRSLARRLTADS